MDLRAPGVPASRFPQTPGKVCGSTCKTHPPLCKLMLAGIPTHTLPGTPTPPYALAHGFLRFCPGLDSPVSFSNNLGFLKVRASWVPRAARNRTELAIPQTLLLGSRRKRRGKLPGLASHVFVLALCVIKIKGRGSFPSPPPTKHQNKQPNEMRT